MSLLDLIYSRMDITPLDGYEREIWWGEYVKCMECRKTYVVAEDQEWGFCVECGGIVSKTPKAKLKLLILGKTTDMWP